MRRWVFLIWIFLVAIKFVAAQSSVVRVVSLKVEDQPDSSLISTARPLFAWNLSSTKFSGHNVQQIAYRIEVAKSLLQLSRNQRLLWDSGKVDNNTYWQRPYLGPSLKSNTRYYWRVQCWSIGPNPGPWSSIGHFSTGLLSESEWSARWIAAERDRTQLNLGHEDKSIKTLADAPKPLPVFWHDFVLEKPIATAFLSVAGLGQYEVHINGKAVTNTVLNPAWTNYRKTVSYDSYDVSSVLRRNRNTLGIILGNGMYNVEGVRGHYTKFIGSFGQPKCILQLDVRYADGTSTRVISNSSWKTKPGPVLYSSIYGGETYDARILASNWDRSTDLKRNWQAALEVSGPGGRLTSRLSAPMIVDKVYKPVKVTSPKPGTTVYDLGTNMSGWPSITVQGLRGSKVHLLPGELINLNGRVSQRSTNASPANPVIYTYVLRGGAPERWHPHFTYHSFRYVELTTEPATSDSVEPRVTSLAGDFVHANVPVVGTFTSSNLLFNRIHGLIDRAVLSNLASVITDCPSREKLGWLEQTYLNASTIMFNYDVRGLYAKTVADMIDSQLRDGLVPSIAPEFVQFVDENGKDTAFRDSPEWGSAVILSPWELYRYTGDSRPLDAGYEAMKNYVSYLKRRLVGGLLDYGLGDWYDIGPNPPGPSQLTSKWVTASGVYYEDLQTLSQIATLLGHMKDAEAYFNAAVDLRAEYNRKLFHPETDVYDRGSQTSQAIPLALGIVPAGHVQAVLDNLVSDIRRNNNHVTGGDIGFYYIVLALTENGRSDVLADILSRTDSPSYGYQLKRGATTLTEAWDANPESSQNHFMLGHGEHWFYRGLAGLSIDMTKAPDDALTFQPSFVDGVRSAAASYRSPLGLARIAWKHSGRRASVSITVPAGAKAHLKLPKGVAWQADLPSRSFPVVSTDLILGSGDYRFSTLASVTN